MQFVSLIYDFARLLANFGVSQTPSLVSHSKFAENYESYTENPSVVDSAHIAQNLVKIFRHCEAILANHRNNPNISSPRFERLPEI